ncbi:MAG: hypothetical protein HC875_16930, partial [Anaerolineales bacterium]|nr:hypothetical protein [Anaerolineales bacterium]
DPAPTYTLNGELNPVEALDLAISIMEEKAEPDRLLVKMIELHPALGPIATPWPATAAISKPSTA